MHLAQYADLKSTELNQLLSQSELIVAATVEEFNSDGLGKGSARLDVKKVYKGELSNKKIILSWSTEVHEQRIDKQGEYLLFLKSRKSQNGSQIGPTHQATHYGRSYWSIESNEGSPECKRVTHYVYPISMVDVEKAFLISRQDKKKTKKDTNNFYICVERVLEVLGVKRDKSRHTAKSIYNKSIWCDIYTIKSQLL